MLRTLLHTKLQAYYLSLIANTMAHCKHLVVFTVALAAFVASCAEASGGFGFDLHHRSSPVVRRWAEARGHRSHWPAHGSPEYYSTLSRHDRALLARRGLAGEDGLLTFASGNGTRRINELGFIYYAEVSVGTPKETFLVALDTGSDLFWVPCDCKQCAPIANVTEPGEPDLRPYSPRLSSTSKPVTCDHDLCDRPNACGGNGSSCPYAVRYVSADTSSSGVLVEDVLHLTREGREAVQAPVVLGCGQVQTGLFLGGPASDGLLGLGLDKVSVPSVLASRGLIASDSFSMCFSRDGVGRINFGDTGSRDQDQTPFTVTNTNPTYNVSFTSINVGSSSAPANFTAVMDSGTSFTYLDEPEYTRLTTYLNLRVLEARTNLSRDYENSSVPFEYCYRLSRDSSEVFIPEVSLTTKGGSRFPVTRPIIVYGDEVNGETVPVGYCLGILRSDVGFNIIGQNFMTGLKIVFDRERSVLGWQEFDCYKNAPAAAGSEPPSYNPWQNAPAAAGSEPPSYNPWQNGLPNPLWRPFASRGHAARTLGVMSSLLLPLLLAAALVF